MGLSVNAQLLARCISSHFRTRNFQTFPGGRGNVLRRLVISSKILNYFVFGTFYLKVCVQCPIFQTDFGDWRRTREKRNLSNLVWLLLVEDNTSIDESTTHSRLDQLLHQWSMSTARNLSYISAPLTTKNYTKIDQICSHLGQIRSIP